MQLPTRALRYCVVYPGHTRSYGTLELLVVPIPYYAVAGGWHGFWLLRYVQLRTYLHDDDDEYSPRLLGMSSRISM